MSTEEKEKTIFEQNCQDFRSLNEIMWKIPIIVITLTGGLWFGVGSMNISDHAKTALLLLAGSTNLIFIVVLFRLRYVMNNILKEVKKYQGIQPGVAYIFVSLFSLLLMFSATVSFYASYRGAVFYKPKEVTEKLNEKKEIINKAVTTKGK